MGKILDRLRRTPSKIIAAGAPAIQPEDEVVAVAPVNEDSLPFIEVGGKDKPAQASADVLAFGPLPTKSTLLNDEKRSRPSAFAVATGATLRLLAAASTHPKQAAGIAQEPMGQPAAW